MIVIVCLLTIIAINSSINIYEFFKKIKKNRYESIRKEVLCAINDDGRVDADFWYKD